MSALQKSLAGPKRYKNSCTECQRRKQKCNRLWPCIHCQKRDDSTRSEFNNFNTTSCQFIDKKSNAARKNRRRNIAPTTEATLQNGEELGNAAVAQGADRKRCDDDHDSDAHSDHDHHDHAVDNSAIVHPDDLNRLANQHFDEQLAAFGAGAQAKWPTFERRHDDQYCVSASACPELLKALEALPQRRDLMDALVLSFFQNVNPHYSLIHQAEFAAQYTEWWRKKANNDPLPVPWTCLLLMLCACACQHLPVDIQEKLEEMFHSTCQDLTEDYHYRARNLYSVIPAGQYHRDNVMWLLHSTYWYKAEAMFAECCHVFNTAVREAQELGFNREENSEGLPDHEREMRRRAWCIIDAWDWQIASGLCRDTIIDHSTCNVERPSLTLELDGQFSPLMHMNMQSDLIHKLAERFHSPAKIRTPSQVMEYKEIIAEWMQDFPPIFAVENPDTSYDEKQTWIEYHRHYNYTMGYMMMLNPFRPHMKLPFTEDTPEDVLELRTIAIDLAIRLVKVLDDWISYLTFRDGRFHFIIFSLVDAAMMLADVISNDKVGSIPRREEIYSTVKATRAMQGKLYCLSRSAKVGFRIIHKTVRKLISTAPTEDRPFLPDEKDDDNGQGVLAAALESISLTAPKNDRSVDAENRMDLGLKEQQEQQETEKPAEVSEAEHGLQPVYDAVPLSSNYNDALAVSSNPIDSTIYECHEAAPPDDDEHMASGRNAITSSEYILPMTSAYAPAATSNYTLAAPPTHSTATSSYIDPTIYNYEETAPLQHVEPVSLGYAAIESLTDSAVVSAYDESEILNDVLSVPLDYVGDPSFNHITTESLGHDAGLPFDQGAVTSLDFSTAASLSVERPIPVDNTSAYFGSTGATPAVDFVANPELFSAPTTYITYTVYDDAGIHTFYYNAPTAYATTSSETYNAPAVYSTFVPYIVPTTYGSSATSFTPPETNSSPENSENAAAYTATVATAVGTPYTPTDGREKTAHTATTSNSNGTPESNYTPLADTNPINQSISDSV